MAPPSQLPPAYARADASPAPLMGCAGQQLEAILSKAARDHAEAQQRHISGDYDPYTLMTPPAPVLTPLTSSSSTRDTKTSAGSSHACVSNSNANGARVLQTAGVAMRASTTGSAADGRWNNTALAKTVSNLRSPRSRS